MPRLAGIKLHNICQHADLDVEIRPGLTAIVGRNGAGKTSLLRGLMYALTGLVDGMWGTQQSMQKDGTADPGYAEARLVDGNDSFSVRRFSTSSVKFVDGFKRNGEMAALKRKAVDAELENLFGMSLPLMFQICWGRQGELAQLLTAPPAVIQAFLAQVFDTRWLERIRDRLKSELSSIVQLSAICKDSLAGDEAAMVALPDEETLEAACAKATVEANELRKQAASIADPRETERRRSQLAGDIARMEARLTAMDKPDRPREKCGDYQDICRTLETARSIRDRAQDASVEQYRALDAATIDVRTCSEKLETLLLDNRAILDDLDAETSDRCPLCGGHVDDTDAIRNSLCRLKTGCDTVADYDEQCRRRHDALMLELDAAETRKKAADANIQALSDSIHEAEALIDDKEKEATSVLWYAASSKLDSLRAQLDSIGQPDDDGGIHDRLEEAVGRERSAMSALAENRAQRAALLKSIEQGRRTVAQYEINASATGLLSEMRDALSAGRVQARYLQMKIRLLNKELQKHMRATGMPFTLRLDEDKHMFMYTTEDGYEHTAAQLSGAQKSMSSVALQMALVTMLKPAISLFLLDEPAEALDEQNKRVMADMFRKLNTVLPAMNGTMLLVTRDQQLIESCNNVIDIGDVSQ